MTFLCHVGPKQHWHAGGGRSEWWEETLKHMDQQWKTNISAATDDQHRLTSLFLLHSRPRVSSAFPFFFFLPSLTHPLSVFVGFFFILLNTLLPLEESREGRLQGREMKTKRRTTSLALSLLAALLIHWPSSCSSSLHPYCTSSPGSDFSPPALRLYLLHQGGVLGSKLTS